jgi:hypothetical protein
VDSLILSVAIGLVFTFAVLAAVTSIVTEGIARFLGLRGEYLLRGLRSMLDGDGEFALVGWWKGAKDWLSTLLRKLRGKEATKTTTPKAVVPPSGAVSAPATREAKWVTLVMQHPLISPSGSQGQVVEKAGDGPLTNKQRRTLPSYVSARSFAQAVIDLVVTDAKGKTSFTTIQDAIEKNVDSPVLQKSLLTLLRAAQGDVDQFRQEIERWYDDQMARVSGWYKRHVRWISLVIGLVLVLAFNVNAISIGRALYGDEALREAVVTQAAQAAECSKDEGAASCLQKIEQQVTNARALGLPLGWERVPQCTTGGRDCTPAEAYGLADPDRDHGAVDALFFLTALLGYLLMVLSLVPGARFWFDLLDRLGSLRSTGPKPKPAS